MTDNRYGSCKVKVLRVLSLARPGALSTRSLCIYTGIEYRVMAVSLLKWLKQGLIIKSREPNFYHQTTEDAYSIIAKGMDWLSRHYSQYICYHKELDAWQGNLDADSLEYWHRLGFVEFQERFTQLVRG